MTFTGNGATSAEATSWNDAQSELYGLQKGSKSPCRQYASINFARALIEEGAFPLFVQVSGRKLIEEGTDDGSKKHAEAIRRPVCGSEVKAQSKCLARRANLEISVDMFASSCNALVPRFKL